MPTGYEPAQGGKRAAAGSKFCGKTHDKYATLASTAGTQPALCVGTTKRQFVFFPRLEFHFLLVLDSRGKSKKAQ